VERALCTLFTNLFLRTLQTGRCELPHVPLACQTAPPSSTNSTKTLGFPWNKIQAHSHQKVPKTPLLLTSSRLTRTSARSSHRPRPPLSFPASSSRSFYNTPLDICSLSQRWRTRTYLNFLHVFQNRRSCLVPATSEKDRLVARKRSESIQDYSLQTPVFRPPYELCHSRS
jgi:hypothetical protein